MADDSHSADAGVLATPIFTLTIELSPTTWQVRTFQVELALSSIYTLRVEAITDDDDVDPEGLVGRTCELTIARGAESRGIAGIVLAVDIAARGDDRLGLTFEIGPALAILAHRSDYRVHHGLSAPALVRERLEAALGELGRGLRSEVDESAYPALELCTQHGETDLEFIERVLAEAGIYYHFEVEDGREVLVLADESPRARVIDHAGEGGELPIVGKGTGVTEAESIRDFSRTSALTSDRVAAGQWRWETADEVPRIETAGARDGADGAGAGGLPGRQLYVHDAPNAPVAEQAARMARQILEQARAGATRGRGTSDAIGMLAGRVFKAVGHAQQALDGAYLLTRVTLRGDAPEVQAHGDAAASSRFSCHFEAIPADVRWRPPRPSRRPSLTGPMVAHIWGPDGDEEIQVDSEGRVPIRFPWDRGPADRPSAWVRLARAAAGNGMGTQYIPRRGDEVMVQFVCGDPSQPLVTGALHNSLNRPAYSPEEKAIGGYRSQSTPAGSGYCEISCDDTKGRERVLLRSARDMDVIAKGDYTRTVGGKQTMTVEEGLEHTVKLDEVITVGGSQVIDVYKDRLIFVSGERLSTQVYNGEIVTTADKGPIRYTAGTTFDVTAKEGTISLVSEAKVGGIKLHAKTSGMRFESGSAAEIQAPTVDLNAEHWVRLRTPESSLTIYTDRHKPATGQPGVSISAKGHASISADAGVSLASARGMNIDIGQTLKVMSKNVTITSEVIELKVGGSSIKITPAGIEISGPVVKINS